MDQSHLCGLWKRRRRPSIKSKRTLSPGRNPWREGEQRSRRTYPRTHDHVHNRSTNTSVAVRSLDVHHGKGCIISQGCSIGPRHSSVKSSRKKCELISEDCTEDPFPRRFGSKVHKSFAPDKSFNMKDGQAFHLKREHPRQQSRMSRSPMIDDISSDESKLTKLLRRFGTTNTRSGQQSSVTAPSHGDAKIHVDPLTSPIPGIGIEPPIIPDDLTSGAAARAAAATQNEILEFVRNLKLAGATIAKDAESGIGIEIRDRAVEIVDVPIPRKGRRFCPRDVRKHFLIC